MAAADASARPGARPRAAAAPRSAEELRRQAEESGLIEAILDGDIDLYRHLVVRYQGALCATLVRLVGNPGEAEELAQQSFIDAYDALPRFDRTRRFSTWLYRIAVNNAKDWLKSHKRSEQPLDGAVAGDQAVFSGAIPGPEQAASAREEIDRLSAALAALPLPFREVILLKDVQGLSYEEIHEILGHPITTLKIRAVRGRAALRKLLSG